MNGEKLKEWGIPEGKHFRDLLNVVNLMENKGSSLDEIKFAALKFYDDVLEKQKVYEESLLSLRTNSRPFEIFLDPESDDERENLKNVIQHMDAIMRLPTVERAAVMPDSMPAGNQLGTIPVGGVIETKGTIHPGMHSADICCSMAVTIFKRNDDVKRVLDEAMKVTHFGLGKRSKSEVRRNHKLKELISKFEGNSFLDNKKFVDAAENHFMTQGDGNHFLYVGELESTGQMCLVTHHGSRSLGGLLYKHGMSAAKKHTAVVAPRIPEHQAWLDYDSKIGHDYWIALQTVRLWTKMNHFAIHETIAKRLGNSMEDWFWNEHNFVFKRGDNFFHAKGATPSYDGYSLDDNGITIIPLNMAQPILLTSHANSDKNLGFAPHGAGRNLSRTEHTRRIVDEFGVRDQWNKNRTVPKEVKDAVLKRETEGLDIRFYTGDIDISELPSSYKNAEQVQSQINKYGLATVEDRIMPRGSIMAGVVDMPWKKK